ncbi:hypothetical protein GGR53DRAFT_516854 [Hypoxylon sp. FL1150]|nr:hypothetical protein GGR53DRAFT_516854 [Hypoxylon sp. FL1150]
MSSDGLKIKPLPSAAAAELEGVARWLQSEKADFKLIDKTNICHNKEGLREVMYNLINELAAKVNFPSKENLVSAIHYEEPAVIPVEVDWVVYLIPIHALGGTILVDGQQLNLGHYCHLEGDVRVRGKFFAVLLLSR